MKSTVKPGIVTFLNAGMLVSFFHIVYMVFANNERFFDAGIYVSIGLWIASIALWILAVISLKKYGKPKPGDNYMKTTQLVTRGIFRFVRHPQYVAYILFNLGIVLKIQTGFSIALGILAILFLAIGMKEEDKHLSEKFGDAFNEYSNKHHKVK
jgi:protein-S-isoprenylcysteine O-methyltransferase Ste14